MLLNTPYFESLKMCNTQKTSKSADVSNPMVDKSKWMNFPILISEGSFEATAGTAIDKQVKFYNIPKLGAFQISAKHSALKDVTGLPSTSTVIILKTGYSSGLILEVKGGDTSKFLSKKVIFNDTNLVRPLGTRIEYLEITVAKDTPAEAVS